MTAARMQRHACSTMSTWSEKRVKRRQRTGHASIKTVMAALWTALEAEVNVFWGFMTAEKRSSIVQMVGRSALVEEVDWPARWRYWSMGRERRRTWSSWASGGSAATTLAVKKVSKRVEKEGRKMKNGLKMGRK